MRDAFRPKRLSSPSTGVEFAPISRYPQTWRSELVQQIWDSGPALVTITGGGGAGKSVLALQAAQEFVAENGAVAVWMQCSEHLSSKRSFLDSFVDLLLRRGVIDMPNGSVSNSPVVTTRTLVVLDDFDVAAHQSLEERLIRFLENSPLLHVIVTSREPSQVLESGSTAMRVPVARVGAEDLRFTKQEVRSLLCERGITSTASGASIDDLVEGIHQQTQGWAIAVHASCTELAHVPDYVPTGTYGPFMSEYLEGWLNGLSASSRRVLLISSLVEEWTLEVLVQVCGISMAEAEAGCSEVLKVGGSQSLDRTGTRWFRHHSLVASFLQEVSARELTKAERGKCYSWFARELKDSRPHEAARAALRGQDWEVFEEILTTEGSLIGMMDSSNPSSQLLRSAPSEARRKYPGLGFAALVAEYAFPKRSMRTLVTAFRFFLQEGSRFAIRREGFAACMALTIRMVVARLSGREKHSVALAEDLVEAQGALSFDEQEKHREVLPLLSEQVAVTHLLSDSFTPALRALELPEGSHDGLLPISESHSTSLRAWIHAWRGDRSAAMGEINRAGSLPLPLDWQDTYLGAGYRIARALLALEEGDPDSAQVQLDALGEHVNTIEYWPQLYVLEALGIEQADGAEEALRKLKWRINTRRARSLAPKTSRALLRALQVRLAWHAGQVSELSGQQSYVDQSQVVISLAHGRNSAARATSARLLSNVNLVEFPRRCAELLLLHAEAARRDEDQGAAMKSARAAAKILNSHDLSLPLRVLPADCVQALNELVPELGVKSFSGSESAGTKSLLPLTKSEIRVLGAMMDHGTISDVAEALFLSPQTVKNHLSRSYRKLGVNRKDDAIVVAKEAGYILRD